MAANLLPRSFRKRVARQKALNELQAEKQLREMREQQMSAQTMGMIGRGLGMAGQVYDLADKVAPLFATKGDSSVWQSKDPNATNEQYLSEATAGVAKMNEAPAAQNPPGPPGAPRQPAPPQGPAPQFNLLERTILGPRAGADKDVKVNPFGEARRPDVYRDVPPETDEDLLREARETAMFAAGDGPPQMPAPLAGLRMPSQIRAAEGMAGVHAQMAENERDLFQEKSGATAARFAGAMEQQRRGPLRSGFGSPVQQEVSVAPTMPNLRGGGRPAAQAPAQGPAVPSRPMAVQAPQAATAPQARAPAQDDPYSMERLTAAAATSDKALPLRYNTFHETAAAIQDAASRGDRDRVMQLQAQVRNSALRDVAPTNLREMITGSHLDAARAKLAAMGKIDPMFEANRARSYASAYADNTRGDQNVFNVERGRALLPSELRSRAASATAAEINNESLRERNQVALDTAKKRLRWIDPMNRSTLASQAESRAASSQGRRHREDLHPTAVMRANEAAFESALQQANAQGLRINPYAIGPDGVAREMTTDEQRKYFLQNGRLPNLQRFDPGQPTPWADYPPPTPGAGLGRSPHAADATALQDRADRSSAIAERRVAANKADNPVKRNAALQEIRIRMSKELAKLQKPGSNQSPSAAAIQVREQGRQRILEKAIADLGKKGVSEDEAKAMVSGWLAGKGQ